MRSSCSIDVAIRQEPDLARGPIVVSNLAGTDSFASAAEIARPLGAAALHGRPSRKKITNLQADGCRCSGLTVVTPIL